jgi:hypothetical protein
MWLTVVYRALALLLLAYVVRNFWVEAAPAKKITACMVMIPLALRTLMIK